MSLAALKQRIDGRLGQLIPKDSPHYPLLFEGGRYALLSSGKRIRPLLTLATAEIFASEAGIEKGLQPACALEILHTYSLIHDDLPCMDDDDLRRGRPTLHRVYDEGLAVLVGDYLLTYAFELVATAPDLTAKQRVALVHSLAKGAGAEGMIGGQVMDIAGSQDLSVTHRLKTAALFRVALEFGGIVSEVSEETFQQLKTFGTQFGLLFQIVDDLLDEDHPEGEESAWKKGKRLYAEAHEILDELQQEAPLLRELSEQVWGQLEIEKKCLSGV